MNPTAPTSDFLRVSQVAALLNVSEREVRRLIDRGLLARVGLGRLTLIPRQSYDQLREQWLVEAGCAPVRLPARGRPRKVVLG